MNTYLPIADYGVIGNLNTIALIGKNGSIDWCCLPDFDSASVFGRLLDASKGGFCQVSAGDGTFADRQYLPDTNILRTEFDTPGGRLQVTDFMPLKGDITPSGSYEAYPEIHRILHALDGKVEVDFVWAPRFDYARTRTHIHPVDRGFLAQSDGASLTLGGLPHGASVERNSDGDVLRHRFTLSAGDQLSIVLRSSSQVRPARLASSRKKLQETISVWDNWRNGSPDSDRQKWASPWADLVTRSELTLKLLSYGPTGAIVAAGTTSLPEDVGGVRNWDYRYSWIRDAALSAQALYAMGHKEEAHSFIDWAEHAAEKKGKTDWGLRIMYDIRGNPSLPEEELEHLEGYRGSNPVRIGNKAADQLQLDVYAELVDAAYEIVRLDGAPEWDLWTFLTDVAEEAAERWKEPDFGIWEMRDGPSHFPYSKVRVWSALDKAIQLADAGLINGNVDAWRQTQREIRDEVLSKGVIESRNAFKRRYGEDVLDASNLLFPMVEFLPFDDPRVKGTIDATLRDLTVSDVVYRYRADDGLPGEEGAFGFCTFWLVDALALSNRMDEAYRIFESMAGHANDLGLFSEQVDPHSGELLGNFPQAFTHIGLINSLLYLAYMEGREAPVTSPIGTREHRDEKLEP